MYAAWLANAERRLPIGALPFAEVKSVVVTGNGSAGVTAADHVRRRHPLCAIHPVGRERHYLYNRMAITQMIYGRSAMERLYLMSEKWYNDQKMTTWLDTKVATVTEDRHRDRETR